MILLSVLVLAQEPTLVAPAPSAEAPAAPAPAAASPQAAAAAAIDPSVIVGAPNGPPLSGDALKAETHRVAKLLRCPVCQGLSVADSPSESALAMKKEVEDLVAKGYDEHQVLEYFETSYGEFIRLEPKFEGINLLVWGAPATLILLGLGGVAWSVRSRKVAPRPPRTSNPDEHVDPALLPYLNRVRAETR